MPILGRSRRRATLGRLASPVKMRPDSRAVSPLRKNKGVRRSATAATTGGDPGGHRPGGNTVQLTPRQRAALKARAHPLEPVVTIGQAGASAAAIAEVERSLAAH